jgi:hypothetical protein
MTTGLSGQKSNTCTGTSARAEVSPAITTSKLSRSADGLYVSPQFAFSNAKVSATDSLGNSAEGEASSLIVSGLVGYGWFWDSFNIHLGGGLALPVGTSKVKVKNSDGTEESVDFSRTGRLALEFNLGWTF